MNINDVVGDVLLLWFLLLLLPSLSLPTASECKAERKPVNKKINKNRKVKDAKRKRTLPLSNAKQTVLYPTSLALSLSLSATLSSNCDSILMAAAATETTTAGQCPSIGESVLARTYVCVCARSLGLTLVTVTQSQSQSPSASQSAFDLSRSAAAEAAAAAAQRFLLLYSLHLRSISFRFRRLQMLFSLSVSLSRILFAPTNLHQKQFDLY